MKAGCCKHYNGNVYQRGKCDAGVSVRERVGGPDDGDGWLRRMPCMPGDPKQTPAFQCEHLALPTAEEIEADRQESRKSIERGMTARKAILAAGAKPRTAGRLECPVCKTGELHWSMAGNGHVHARCTTAGCVSWME